MSFIGDLFGGGQQQQAAPAPAPVTPRLSDATSEAASREEAARLKNRNGASGTVLTSGLGDTNAGTSNIQRTTALGGNSSLTS